jgi:diketogulonate reductase-like aldo/keto reductase
MDICSKTKLNNDVEMPWLGLGVFEAHEGGEVERAVGFALQHGYRSIDTASFYENETGVGKAIRESGISREEIFVTTKMWNNEQGYRNTLRAFDSSLDKLQLNYIDLYLVHWPLKKLSGETWKALEELYEKGKVRAIGVSNFLVHHLEEFLPNCKIKPMVNQVEFHPEVAQPDLLEYCKNHQIQLEAWSPIMKGAVNDIPVLQALGLKYGKSPVQIVLRWEIQKGVVTIPKSVTPERIIANADIFDFEINPDDMVKIDRLDKNRRTGLHPDYFYENF